MENMKVNPVSEWKRLQGARDYKTSNSLYDIARKNEEYAVGIQWNDIDAKNLTKNTSNFLGQIVEVKTASILANEITIARSVDEMDEEDERIQQAVKAFNLADKKNWERLKMDRMTEQLVNDGAIQGIGVSYWYWDENVKSGNTFVTSGDINGQLVDMVDLYVANPNEVNIQKQPWNKITVRMTVSELKELAKEKGVPEDQIETITSDEDEITYSAFEKTDTDQDNFDNDDDLATLSINFKKKDGRIWCSKTTKTVVIDDWFDTELSRYPIVIYTYKTRKKFIYGEAEITRYIENQKSANLLQAARVKHTMLFSIPKWMYNKNMISSWTNAIGSIHGINAAPQTDIRNAIAVVQPAPMSVDVDKSIEEMISRTQDLAGVNQNIRGEARPENAAALLTQIKQASIPNESYKRRLYDYYEDVALIWEDFYKTKYNMSRRMKDEEGEEVEFVGTDFADTTFTTKIDVGPSSQWSEITSWAIMKEMWQLGMIKNPNDVFKRIPSELVQDLDGLIQENDDEQLMQQLMGEVLKQLDPMIQQQIAQLPPEEQKEMIRELLGGQNEM